MWERISKSFRDKPERLSVARVIIENGLHIEDGRVYCDNIEIPNMKIARAAGVDRRTVSKTVGAINADEELKLIFTKVRSAGASLKEIARHLGFGVVEISAYDPKTTWVVAEAARIISEVGISIRQVLTDDPELSPDPKLTLIADKKLPGESIPKFLKIRGVKKVSVY